MAKDASKVNNMKNQTKDSVLLFVQENGYDQKSYNNFKNQILDVIIDSWVNIKPLWALVLRNRVMDSVMSDEYVLTLVPQPHDGVHFSQNWSDEELLFYIHNDKNRFDRVKKTLLEKVVLEYEYAEKYIFGTNFKGCKGNKAHDDNNSSSTAANNSAANLNSSTNLPVFNVGKHVLHSEPLPSFNIENVICTLSDKDRSAMEEIRKGIPQGLISLVDKCMKSFQDGAHDLQHCFRVANLALELSYRERNHIKQVGGRRKKNVHWVTYDNHTAVSDFDAQIDHKVVFIAGLCHDVLDSKFQSTENIASMEEELLSSLQNPSDYNCLIPARANHILTIVKNVGYKHLSKKVVDPYTLSLEYQCVQDADLLDAIGAVGIARCYAYGGKYFRPLFGGVVHDPINITPEQYLANIKKDSVVVSEIESSSKHFFDKLFKIKDIVITYSGYQLALPRHHMMVEFLKQVDIELNDTNFEDAGIMTDKIYKEKIIDVASLNPNKRFRQI